MKTRSIMVFVFVLMVGWTFCLVDAHADPGERSAGFRVNGIFPKDDDTDNTAGFMGYLGYQMTEHLRGEIESGWIQVDEDILGDLNIIPLLANLQITFPWPQDTETGRPALPLTPYITGGIGVLFFEFDESQTLRNAGASIEVDTSLAFKLGGGFDYRFNDTVGLNVDGGYIFSESEADLRQGSTPLASDDVEADYWFVGGGLRVYW